MSYTETQVGVDEIDETVINIGDNYIKVIIGGTLLSDALSLTFINKSKDAIIDLLNKNNLNKLQTDLVDIQLDIKLINKIGNLKDHTKFKKRIINSKTLFYNRIIYKWFKLGEIYISVFKMIYFTLLKIYENKNATNKENNKKFEYNKEFINDMKSINIIN
tara:strand:- start:460 stop:942 length:483 start_codon:yes stop_codon:yes gene_type:complete